MDILVADLCELPKFDQEENAMRKSLTQITLAALLTFVGCFAGACRGNDGMAVIVLRLLQILGKPH